MDISTLLESLPTWFTDQPVLYSNVGLAYIALTAIVPLLIAVMMRDLLAFLWAALFALGAISLYATQQMNWTLLNTLAATAAFFLAFGAVVQQRLIRKLHDQERAQELSELKARLNVLEACEQRRIMRSLNRLPLNTADMNELMPPSEEAKDPGANFPIAPKIMSSGMAGPG